MITGLTLKFGRAPGVSAERIVTTPITVFVGPNNSGKSKILREIHRYCTTGQRDAGDVLVESIEFEGCSAEEAEARVRRVTLPRRVNEAMNPDHVIVGRRGVRNQVHRERLLSALQNASADARHFCPWYLSFNTLILDGQSRINLVGGQPAGDLQLEPHSSFQVLFSDNTKRGEVRRIIRDAFGLYFVIDPTQLGQFRLRLSPRAPISEQEERGIDEAAVRFHGAALSIDEASDGVKAFTGMITEFVAGDPHVLLIDEPEAFLHPAVAFKLGKELALASMGSEKRLFVSTHSPNFVMGCIQSGAPVNIVRLTYRDDVATARLLPSAEILRLMRNPLLRSTGVLSGLFYECVVVTEADTDRAFYEEVNERLLRHAPERGIPNCLFLRAQNKQTLGTIMRPLRELGIPAAGIVDIDVLKDGGRTWTGALASVFVPPLEHQGLANLRAAALERFTESGQDMKRDGGVDVLMAAEKEAVNNLFDKLEQYGLFAVRKGELESWLRTLGAAGKGPDWLVDIFQKMGEDPALPDYVRPANDDVWEFMGSVRRWLLDATRRGIPN